MAEGTGGIARSEVPHGTRGSRIRVLVGFVVVLKIWIEEPIDAVDEEETVVIDRRSSDPDVVEGGDAIGRRGGDDEELVREKPTHHPCRAVRRRPRLCHLILWQ